MPSVQMKSLITIKMCITYNKYNTCRSIAKWNDDFFYKEPQKHHYCESILYVLIHNNQWAETHCVEGDSYHVTILYHMYDMCIPRWLYLKCWTN